jgi:hypothetical protein
MIAEPESADIQRQVVLNFMRCKALHAERPLSSLCDAIMMVAAPPAAGLSVAAPALAPASGSAGSQLVTHWHWLQWDRPTIALRFLVLSFALSPSLGNFL